MKTAVGRKECTKRFYQSRGHEEPVCGPPLKTQSSGSKKTARKTGHETRKNKTNPDRLQRGVTAKNLLLMGANANTRPSSPLDKIGEGQPVERSGERYKTGHRIKNTSRSKIRPTLKGEGKMSRRHLAIMRHSVESNKRAVLIRSSRRLRKGGRRTQLLSAGWRLCLWEKKENRENEGRDEQKGWSFFCYYTNVFCKRGPKRYIKGLCQNTSQMGRG